MSWQGYVDTSLVGSGHVDQAAIFNSEGTSCWAASAGFSVLPAELKEVVAAFNDTKDPKTVVSTGLHVANDKYFILKADDKSIYGKKGKDGIVIVKTKQTILITHYNGDIQPGQAVTTVEKVGDYLIGTGY